MSERVAIVVGAGGELGRATAEKLAHAVAPEAVADIIVHLVSDAAAPVRGAIVPPRAPEQVGEPKQAGVRPCR